MLPFRWGLLGVALLIACVHAASINSLNIDNNFEYNDEVRRSKREYKRGQTQSQYLNFGQPELDGKAEAEATDKGSRSTVSGTHGMGQAQSQFSSGDCSGCGVGGPAYEYSTGSPDPLRLGGSYADGKFLSANGGASAPRTAGVGQAYSPATDGSFGPVSSGTKQVGRPGITSGYAPGTGSAFVPGFEGAGQLRQPGVSGGFIPGTGSMGGPGTSGALVPSTGSGAQFGRPGSGGAYTPGTAFTPGTISSGHVAAPGISTGGRGQLRTPGYGTDGLGQQRSPGMSLGQVSDAKPTDIGQTGSGGIGQPGQRRPQPPQLIAPSANLPGQVQPGQQGQNGHQPGTSIGAQVPTHGHGAGHQLSTYPHEAGPIQPGGRQQISTFGTKQPTDTPQSSIQHGAEYGSGGQQKPTYGSGFTSQTGQQVLSYDEEQPSGTTYNGPGTGYTSGQKQIPQYGTHQQGFGHPSTQQARYSPGFLVQPGTQHSSLGPQQIIQQPETGTVSRPESNNIHRGQGTSTSETGTGLDAGKQSGINLRPGYQTYPSTSYSQPGTGIQHVQQTGFQPGVGFNQIGSDIQPGTGFIQQGGIQPGSDFDKPGASTQPGTSYEQRGHSQPSGDLVQPGTGFTQQGGVQQDIGTGTMTQPGTSYVQRGHGQPGGDFILAGSGPQQGIVQPGTSFGKRPNYGQQSHAYPSGDFIQSGTGFQQGGVQPGTGFGIAGTSTQPGTNYKQQGHAHISGDYIQSGAGLQQSGIQPVTGFGKAGISTQPGTDHGQQGHAHPSGGFTQSGEGLQQGGVQSGTGFGKSGTSTQPGFEFGQGHPHPSNNLVQSGIKLQEGGVQPGAGFGRPEINGQPGSSYVHPSTETHQGRVQPGNGFMQHGGIQPGTGFGQGGSGNGYNQPISGIQSGTGVQPGTENRQGPSGVQPSSELRPGVGVQPGSRVNGFGQTGEIQQSSKHGVSIGQQNGHQPGVGFGQRLSGFQPGSSFTTQSITPQTGPGFTKTGNGLQHTPSDQGTAYLPGSTFGQHEYGQQSSTVQSGYDQQMPASRVQGSGYLPGSTFHQPASIQHGTLDQPATDNQSGTRFRPGLDQQGGIQPSTTFGQYPGTGTGYVSPDTGVQQPFGGVQQSVGMHQGTGVQQGMDNRQSSVRGSGYDSPYVLQPGGDTMYSQTSGSQPIDYSQPGSPGLQLGYGTEGTGFQPGTGIRQQLGTGVKPGVSQYSQGPQHIVQPGSTYSSGGVQTVGVQQATGDAGSDDAFSQAESTIGNGQAAASAQGKKNGGTAKTQVQGTYSSTGSFSASAMTSDIDRSASSQVTGGVEGAMSQSQGQGGAAQSQAQVQVNGKNGGTKASSQSGGIIHQSQSEVQANDKGGLADAQSSGPGQTSSQAQIGFRPGQDGEIVRSTGGGQASAQSGTHFGNSQSQIQGTSKFGISYHGAAQSASGTKEQVATYREQNRELFNTISHFGSTDAVTDRVDTVYNPALTSESDIPDVQLKSSRTITEVANSNKLDNDESNANDEDDEEEPYDEYDDEEDYYNENPIKINSKTDSKTDSKKLDSPSLYRTHTQTSPTQTQQVSVADPKRKYTVVQNQNGRIQTYPFRTTTETVPSGFRGTVNIEKKFHTKSLEPHKSENKPNATAEGKPEPKPRKPDSFVTVTKSVTGSMDNSKNPPQDNKNFQSTYYTKSSTCGYFTFSCNIVYGANGRSKICRPKAPVNGKC